MRLYLIDPAYGWVEQCERRFGTHPIQVINEVNAAAHVADVESEPSKRAFTRELSERALLDWSRASIDGVSVRAKRGSSDLRV